MPPRGSLNGMKIGRGAVRLTGGRAPDEGLDGEAHRIERSCSARRSAALAAELGSSMGRDDLMAEAATLWTGGIELDTPDGTWAGIYLYLYLDLASRPPLAPTFDTVALRMLAGCCSQGPR